ncbi:hypothetical protein V2J09_000378 [Rumex salicifolius]
MASVNLSSEDDGYDQHSYSISADISESESSSSFSGRRFQPEPFSTSISSSPFAFRPLVGNCSFPAPPPLLFPVIGGRDVVLVDDKGRKPETDLSDLELMKERFAKLLLGEDMSGGGKGVGTALAITNAITNLAASVFGELWRLEPLAPQRKKMWCREMDWLLCVSDSIVELVPEMQEIQGVGTFEIMATRPRLDLYANLPALKKLDAMLLGVLDEFKETEFWYIERGISVSEVGAKEPPMVRQEDKWWLPCPKVPSNGLSVAERKKVQKCRDCTNQILKAAFAINGSVLAEMETPSAYLETLPKNGKACLGDIIYRYITAEQFSPDCLLDCLDLSSEHHTLEVANRIEASMHVWRQKDQKRHLNHSKSKRSKWGGKVKGLVADHDKDQVLTERAEALLATLKLRCSGLPQTALDMSKIQYNKDVGQAILESYSRVIESLAYNIMARIDDLLFVDDATKQQASCAESKSVLSRGGFGSLPIQKRMSPYASPFATPNLCFSPVSGSQSLIMSSNRRISDDLKLEKLDPFEFERIWSHPGNLCAAKAGDVPERD